MVYRTANEPLSLPAEASSGHLFRLVHTSIASDSAVHLILFMTHQAMHESATTSAVAAGLVISLAGHPRTVVRRRNFNGVCMIRSSNTEFQLGAPDHLIQFSSHPPHLGSASTSLVLHILVSYHAIIDICEIFSVHGKCLPF